MKLQRFFVGSACEGNKPVRIPSLELVHQLKNVFRMVKNDHVILFDNSGYDFLAIIDGFEGDSVSFSNLLKQENSVKARRETWLFAALVKKDTFEWIIEKATELGVSHIVPIISDRTEKKGLNLDRITKVSIEASEQSGRATVPKVHDILKLADAIATYKYLPGIAWEPAAPKFDKNDMDTIVSMWIGPEGGWTEKELEMFRGAGIKVRSLGPQVLRAETAVVAALSQVVF